MTRIPRHLRTIAAATVLGEAGGSHLMERARLAQAMWEGWREVMRIKLGAYIYCEWQELNRRAAK